MRTLGFFIIILPLFTLLFACSSSTAEQDSPRETVEPRDTTAVADSTEQELDTLMAQQDEVLPICACDTLSAERIIETMALSRNIFSTSSTVNPNFPGMTVEFDRCAMHHVRDEDSQPFGKVMEISENYQYVSPKRRVRTGERLLEVVVYDGTFLGMDSIYPTVGDSLATVIRILGQPDTSWAGGYYFKRGKEIVAVRIGEDDKVSSFSLGCYDKPVYFKTLYDESLLYMLR